MSQSRYDAYKDSGVAWLGQVPAHWEVKRLKTNADIIPSNIDKKSYDDELPIQLCNYTDVYYNDIIVPEMPFMQATASQEQIHKFSLKAGDIIVTKDSETADDIAIPAYVPQTIPNVVCGYHLALIRITNGIIGKYLFYYFLSVQAKSYFETRANGLTRVGLGQAAIGNLPIPLPPLAEQQAIATFLDRECARIDALVAAQQRMIALSKEKRQALISHAVTRGIDPAAPCKDSGVAWLGQVPAHWEVRRLKHSVNFAINGVWGDEPQNNENDVVCVRVADFNRNSRTVTIHEPTIRNVSLRDRLTRGLKKGNLLLEKSGGGDLNPVGFVALYTHELEAVCSNFIAKIELSHNLSPEYWCYFHAAAYFSRLNVKSIKQTSGIQNLDQSQYFDELAIFPPLVEQQAIAAFLDRECARIDMLIERVEQAIVLLRERRSALIAAAVTGQIRVGNEE